MIRRAAVLAAALTMALVTAPANADDNDDRSLQSDCISISHIRRTEVIDDRTVLFYMTGGKIRKVSLAFRCPSLAFYKSFSYRAYTSRLCARVDEIVARSGSHCPIGDIDDISAEEAAALKQAAKDD